MIKNKYDDIIDLEHPTSKTHPRMSMHDRAAQFSPFAALTGFDDCIDEEARRNTERMNCADAYSYDCLEF